MKTRLSILVALLMGGMTATAQQLDVPSVTGDGDEFGLDFSLGIEKKLAPGLSLELDGNYRTQDQSKRTERWGIEVGLDYRILQSDNKKWNLKAGVSAGYIWQQRLAETEEHFNKRGLLNGYNTTLRHWRNRQRYTVSLTGNYKPTKRWKFQLKETAMLNHYETASATRLKYRYNDDDELYATSDTKDWRKKDRLILRNKLTASYNVRHLPLEPFASVDYGCGLNYSTSKWKFTVGNDFAFSKQSSLSVFYRYQTENDDEEPNGHLVGVGYKFSF